MRVMIRNKEVAPPPKEVDLLRLPYEAAQALLEVCRHISGDPVESPRRFFDEIALRLVEAGVERPTVTAEKGADGIFFRSKRN